MNSSLKRRAFTLLELLIVLTIVGIMAATAIPRYKEFRKRAYDFRAESDLRTIALAEEAYYLDMEKYYPCSNEECLNLPGISRLSQGVQVRVTLAGEDSFLALSSHPKGSGRVYQWESDSGMSKKLE
jgi:prepilin-type N-terminal cleavage/methylation domain-containing protein